MLYGKAYDSKQECSKCDRMTDQRCEDCGHALCVECAALQSDGKLTCADCLKDLLEGDDENEPECECEQIDVDLVDNRYCEVHGGKARAM